jgi:hypothetical protein
MSRHIEKQAEYALPATGALVGALAGFLTGKYAFELSDAASLAATSAGGAVLGLGVGSTLEGLRQDGKAAEAKAEKAAEAKAEKAKAMAAADKATDAKPASEKTTMENIGSFGRTLGGNVAVGAGLVPGGFTDSLLNNTLANWEVDNSAVKLGAFGGSIAHSMYKAKNRHVPSPELVAAERADLAALKKAGIEPDAAGSNHASADRISRAGTPGAVLTEADRAAMDKLRKVKWGKATAKAGAITLLAETLYTWAGAGYKGPKQPQPTSTK